eukprot:scaffold66355_cov62-Phaeocystis_antarctica.AAC.2
MSSGVCAPQLLISASTLLSARVCSTPPACQKSPKQITPASRACASAATLRSSCTHTGIVERCTCRSVNRTKRCGSAATSASSITCNASCSVRRLARGGRWRGA